ncbi:hypothetical protein [Fulvitalea axinellae]|uniref:hypothetical protein n=1 Tax=Fulvitalea axinellae TaxID=1182444 RepID=UPI0030CA217E
MERIYYNETAFSIFRTNYRNTEIQKLEELCPPELKEYCFFDKTKFWRYFYNRLLQEKNYKEMERTLAGTLYRYDPVLYHIYGLYNKEIGNIQTAQKFLFLSGIYTPDTKGLSDAFYNRLKNGHANEFWGLVPEPFLSKRDRHKFPAPLIKKLSELPVPKWLFTPKKASSGIRP